MAADVSAETGNRLVCYCNDCQTYARFLEQDTELDPQGGTDVFHMTPSQFRITEGKEHLACLRLSEKGLMRWFAGCCRTPVANSLASAAVPFVAIVHSFMDHGSDGRSRESVLGPPIALIHGRDARGGLPPNAHPGVPLSLLAHSLRVLLPAWIRGKSRPTPLFDSSGSPVVRPRVLTKEERARAAVRS
jgi:hypothetical protein